MRRMIVVGVVVVALVGVGLWLRSRSARRTNTQEFETATVERGAVDLTVTADGVLKPRTTVQVKSYAGGKVQVLAVEVGDVVKAGDLIAKIDPTDSLATYDQAVADMTAAEARLQQARDQAGVQPKLTAASIAQAEAGYRAAVEDLSRLQEATQPQDRAEARAALDRAKANLDLAETDLNRVRGLRAKGFVPQSDLDTATNRRDLAKTELATAQQRWETLDRQQAAELKAAQAKVTQARAGLDQAKVGAVEDRLRRADVASAGAQVARVEAAVTNAKTALDYTTITAPRDGVILQKLAEEGTIVTSGRSSITQGTDIVLLGDVSQMHVEVSLDEADVGLVRAGQEAAVTVDAFPDLKCKGRIIRVDPQATTQQNVTTVLVTVRVDNPDPRLKPGMTASCRFRVARAEDVLCVPSQAVQEEGGQHTVLVKRDGEVAAVPVEVGLVGDDLTEIRVGLSEGEEVVLPFLEAPPSERTGMATERGRRMGGAGGFIRQGP